MIGAVLPAVRVRPLTIGELLDRAVTLLEFGLGFYALSAISTLLSSENKRLGDFAAGTIVVRDARIAAPTRVSERRA